MLRTCIWDTETDGLLDEVSKIHLLCIKDLITGQSHVFRKNRQEDTIKQGIEFLLSYDLIIGHNSIGYDSAVLKKLHGVEIDWRKQRDTLVLAKLIWPEIKKIDLDRRKKAAGKSFPAQLIGRHSLEAWGHRLGNHKGNYTGGWLEWSQDMEDYCLQDLSTTETLWERILKKEPSEASVLLETQVAHIVARQERHGFLFDEKEASKLYGKLVQRKLELEAEVKKVFRPRYRPKVKGEKGVFTPKTNSKQYGYTAGAPLTPISLVEFNLSSRDHVAEWLIAYYDWQPDEYTPEGKPKVDDETMAKLSFPEAAPLKEYFMVAKRIGQLAEGKEAWLRHVKKDGRIHGSVNTNGAVTGRMTHSKPNMAQVPAGYSPYGHECRALFTVPLGKTLVGCDAAALELRDLAGYMARYDDGAYVKTVLEGVKADGTDIHSVNAKALGLDPKGLYFDGETGRDIAKTWFYAFIYGAGDEKLGFILLRRKGPQAAQRGKKARADFLRNLPALGKLVEQVKHNAKTRGFLYGLDRRVLSVRSQHAALNTLLQSAGAVQMKRALCLLDDSIQEAGLIPGVNYEFVVNCHDEWQIEVDDGIQEKVGEMAVASIRRAGESFGFRCPLDGEWRAGRSWAETH